tara:strand:+ start:901 stop:1041 length:141 start_codon:yes stop_codon:yes gene_type:complete
MVFRIEKKKDMKEKGDGGDERREIKRECTSLGSVARDDVAPTFPSD